MTMPCEAVTRAEVAGMPLSVLKPPPARVVMSWACARVPARRIAGMRVRDI